MKSSFGIALFGLLLALILSFTNLFSGFELSRNSQADPQFHLLRALAMLALAILSSSGLIFLSHKWVDTKNRNLILSGKAPNQKLFADRNTALPAAIVVILLSVLSLISGTISHAGRFPILHAVLGFGVTGAILVSLGLWLKLGLKFIQMESQENSNESSGAA